MFTAATRNFGIWRPNHSSHSRYGAKPTFGIIISLGICAFVGWLIFFLALKIHGDFFLLQNAGLSLVKFTQKEASHFYEERHSGLAVGVKKIQNGNLRILFDSGETFLFPEQKNELIALIRGRAKKLELLSLLTLSKNSAISRVQIWPDSTLKFPELSEILALFTKIGFDDFDVAVEVENY